VARLGSSGRDAVRSTRAGAGTIAWRRAAQHRRDGRPLAAERAYRTALDELEHGSGSRDEVVALRAEYVSLLVEIGRDKEAADLNRLPPG
jgi:hypothetical protein